MTAFTPKRADGKSYRIMMVELLKDRQPGDIVAYREMADKLGVSVKNDLGIIQRTALAANKTLLKLHRRGIENVPKRGYRVLAANEHATAANGHQSKADRQMVRALNFFEGTNLAELTDIERKLHVGQQMLAQATYAGFRHINKRLRRIEELLEGTSTINQ